MRSMFPQSRKTRTRSTTSAGGSWKTSSRGRKRYSTGSGNSFAARNITESLPSCVRMWCRASSEPERVAVRPLVARQQEAIRGSEAPGPPPRAMRPCAPPPP